MVGEAVHRRPRAGQGRCASGGGAEQSLAAQLMTILLDNAIKYSDHGMTIHLTSHTKGKLAYIGVRDEGIGMDAETLAQVFTRFYRAEKSRTTSDMTRTCYCQENRRCSWGKNSCNKSAG